MPQSSKLQAKGVLLTFTLSEISLTMFSSHPFEYVLLIVIVLCSRVDNASVFSVAPLISSLDLG